MLATKETEVDVERAQQALRDNPLQGSAKVIYDMLTQNDRPMDLEGLDRTRRIGKYVDHIHQLPALYRISPTELTRTPPELAFVKLYQCMNKDVQRQFDVEPDAEDLKKPMVILYTVMCAMQKEQSLSELHKVADHHLDYLVEDVLHGRSSTSEGTAPTVRVCAYCCAKEGEDENRLLRCSRCRSAFYCGRICQRMAWVAHKRVCRSAASKR